MAATGKWRVIDFPCRSCLIGAAKPPEEKGVEVSAVEERRGEVSERQLDFACSPFPLPHPACRAAVSRWEKFSALLSRACWSDIFWHRRAKLAAFSTRALFSASVGDALTVSMAS
jgi:hypothetical protein